MIEALEKAFLDELPIFLIFSVGVGLATNAIRWLWLYLASRKYRGWVLYVVPRDAERQSYSSDLLWQEVSNFSLSQFEKRKFIQSVCTSEGIRIKAGQIGTDDINGWAYMDRERKQFLINFKKVPEDILIEK